MAASMPVLFVSHGAPTLAVDPVWGERFAAWGRALPRPRAIVVVSAHWRAREARTGVEATAPLVYDFSGFPRELFAIEYPAPGSAEVAARVRELTGAIAEPARGLDHGVWVPLVHMFPAADVPVVQCALPWRDPAQWWALGRDLAALSAEGVLVIGSGGCVHNLGALAWHGDDVTAPWALEFDAWIAAALDEGRFDELEHVMERAPHLRGAHPTPDHLAPLVVAAAAGLGRAVTFPITGFDLANLGMRCVQLS